MKNRLVIRLSLLSTLLLLSSCAPRMIRHLRYDPGQQAYEATQLPDSAAATLTRDWFVIRHPQTRKKVADSTVAKSLVTWYNYAAGPAQKARFRARPTTSLFGQYRGGFSYFKGAAGIRAGQYRRAIDHFKRAIGYDLQLYYFSDIYFLQAKCYWQLGDSVNTDNYYSHFSSYAQSVCPPYYYLDTPPGYDRTARLTLEACRQEGLPPDHVARRYNGPRLPPRTFPGFIHQPAKKYLPAAEGAVVRTGTGRFTTKLFLQATFPGRIRPFAGFHFGPYNATALGGLDYWFHGTADRRLGVHGVLRTGLVTRLLKSGEGDGYLQYWQTAAGIRAGFFIIPRWGLYLNLVFNNWNPQHRLTIFSDYVKYRVYQPHDINLGTVIYILDNAGLNICYDPELGMKLGLYLQGFHFLY